MSEFNLIDEPWISVVTDYKGTTKLVGLKEFFENAQNYIALAGDMPTQDFAVMRFLLAILHTVFSRYDASGKVYDEIEVNDRMQQVANVDDEYEEEYSDALMKTWKDLWNAEKFPEIVVKYLEAWRDRFYLFDDKYPFYQVTDAIIKKVDKDFTDNKSKTAIIAPKLLNRTISESMNKDALFSPKTKENKNNLNNAELTRWILTFQGVSNASDKKSINDMAGKSIGWIYELGGVFLSSDNMFKTLLLNLTLRHSESQYNNIQKPCWEFNQIDIYNKYLDNETIDNLAELYTNWSRLMYGFIYKGKELKDLVDKKVFRIVKTNSIEAEDMFLEPMTMWKNTEGKYFPKKHEENKAAWRSFGSIINKRRGQDIRLPNIIENLNTLQSFFRKNELIQINTLSAIYKEKDTRSRAMVDEYYDFFNLELYVATDQLEDGWIVRINDIIDKTESFIDGEYKKFIKDFVVLEGVDINNKYSRVNSYLSLLYYKIDKPFRDWLLSIRIDDNKDEKTKEWIDQFKKIVINEIETLISSLSNKFFTGIEFKLNDKTYYKNIAPSLNELMMNINKL